MSASSRSTSSCEEEISLGDGEISQEVSHFSDIIGSFGPYQRNLCILYLLIYLIAAPQSLGVTFYTETPDFKCSDKPKATFASLISSKNDSSSSNYDQHCMIDNSTRCHKWDYDDSFYQSTIVSEFDLVCDNSIYVSYSKSIYQMGYLVSSIFFGYISDRYGRRLAFRMSIILELIMSLSQALSINIYHFLFSRFFLGVGAYTRFVAGTIILIESTGPKHRARVRMFLELGWSVGWLILPGLFYLIPHFRYMQIILFIYELILIFPIWKYFPESPQWLLAKGKFDEATKVLTIAIKKNERGKEQDVIEKLEILKKNKMQEEEDNDQDGGDNKSESSKTIIDLWKVPRLLLFSCVLYFVWFSIAFVSYAVSYNAGDFGGSLYVIFIGFAIVDTINNIFMFLIVEKFKRKTLFLISSFLTAMFLFAMIPFSDNDDYLIHRLVLLLCVKFTANSVFDLIDLMAAEIFPTSVRHIGVGSCSVAARFGSIAAPFVRELNQLTNLATTFTLFGVLLLISGMLGFILPETKDQPIPDTMKQAERRRVRTRSESGIEK